LGRVYQIYAELPGMVPAKGRLKGSVNKVMDSDGTRYRGSKTIWIYQC